MNLTYTNQKGFSYSIESLMSIGMVLVAVILLFGGTGASTPSRDIKFFGADALRSLDEAGVLREYVVRNDTAALENSIGGILPVVLDFELLMCRGSCPAAELPRDKNVVSNFYYLSGAPGNYSATELVLYTWEK